MSTATAGAPAPDPTTTSTASAPRPEATASREVEQARPTRSTASTLGRLTAATVLVCALNGAAAYTFVQSDAVAASDTASARSTALTTVEATVSGMAAEAQTLRENDSGEAAYRARAAEGARQITHAAALAAGAPDEFRTDTGDYERLSSAYTAYVADLERARSVPASSSAEAFAVAQTSKTQNLDPVLTRVREANTARADGASLAANITTGALVLSTLASLGLLLGGAHWLARRTKRIINPGLVGATIASGATSAFALSRLVTDSAVTNGPWAAPVVLLGGLTAAGLAWAGYEQRRKEYR